MKKIWLGLTVLAMGLILCGCGRTSLTVSRGAGTPEEAVECFLEALCQGDVEKMLDCFSADIQAEAISFEAYVDMCMGSYTPYSATASPDYQEYRELLKKQLEGEFAQRIRIMMYSLLVPDPEEYDWGGAIFNVDGTWAADFSDTVDPARLRNLQIVRIDEPTMKYKEDEDFWKQTRERHKAVYGSDDRTEIAALLELDGQLYAAGFILGRYGDDWCILTLQPYSSSSEFILGAATPVDSEQEYLDALLED